MSTYRFAMEKKTLLKLVVEKPDFPSKAITYNCMLMCTSLKFNTEKALLERNYYLFFLTNISGIQNGGTKTD